MITRATTMATAKRPNIVFAHGAGFCKEMWTPIINHLKASPLLQRVPCNLIAYDQPYHGTFHDNSTIDQVVVQRKSDQEVRALHPVLSNWIDWAPKRAHEVIHSLPTRNDQPLIGIGHSMGAVSLWLNEIRAPGTFDQLVLFEPPVDTPVSHHVIMAGATFLVTTTLARDYEWETRQDVENYFRNKPGFASWHPQVLQAYMNHAIVHEQSTGKLQLAILPRLEASIYGGDLVRMTKELLKKPKCPVNHYCGENTRVSRTEFAEYYHQTAPSIYAKPKTIRNGTHLLVFEDPIACAEGILQDLAKLEIFNAVPTSRNQHPNVVHNGSKRVTE